MDGQQKDAFCVERKAGHCLSTISADESFSLHSKQLGSSGTAIADCGGVLVQSLPWLLMMEVSRPKVS